MSPVLTCTGLDAGYVAGRPVLRNVDISLEAGTVLALLGPNGAGKTTLLDAISGYARATGSVELGGRRLDALKPYQRSRAGMGRTFPLIASSKVVLPAPFGPIRPTISPGKTSKLTSLLATTPP